jgi:chemotaxis protein methyltransferase WspC
VSGHGDASRVLALIDELLGRRFGLHTASIGAATLERAVRHRAAACDGGDLHAYWQRLQADADELQELTEAVVVPETWFFRDPAAFGALADFARERAGQALRVLSLPCATGEEPYSIAMTLFDAGLPADSFVVDAVDISARALALARRGDYGRNAFRGEDLRFRERHFEPIAEGRFQVREPLRRAVRWHQANLFADDLLAGRGPYEAVFCRNLLIYFDRAGQERALRVLDALLAEHGRLFVGPSESALLLAAGFEWLKLPRAFAFRRRQVVAPPAALPDARAVPPRPRARPATPLRRLAAAAPPAATPLPQAPPALDQAARLADQGRLDEAERLCREALREQPSSAQAMYLLGLVHDARGEVDPAGDCYRRALYLDPRHEEALLHLALLRERQGDAAGARRLQERARRLQRSASGRPG